MYRAALLFLLILPLGGFGSAERLFAPSAERWPRWERHAPDSRERLEFVAWDALLRRVVTGSGDGINRVDYRSLAGAEAETLAGIVAELEAVPVSTLNRSQQLAYWINLYNAVTLQVVARHYPVASIRDIDISPGWFADGPWDAALVTVEGVALTLNDIEHRILRPVWSDPRIHYAVNCASLGCPNLAPTAYRGGDAERQLAEAARSYVNHPRGVTVAGGEVVVSKIYDWFLEDFGGSVEGLLAHLRRYASPDLAAALAEKREIGGTVYDWALNDTADP
ncbi:DUF547 domain-containing protein [Pelagibius sp. CAU 1746]|uniref:DUF547 domain-containing protein n=1 Tax=Pelagibius sp. CAU 1746 TaxID=3140370 RepID=UPI00325B7614